MHQPTTKLHCKPLCNNIAIITIIITTYHLIATRHVAAKKIHINSGNTIARDASISYVIITLFYITLTLRTMSIKVTYLDISVRNIPITLRHGLFCVCPKPIGVCITKQHRLWLSERTLLTHFTLVIMNSVLDFINFVSGNGLSDYPKSLPEPVFNEFIVWFICCLNFLQILAIHSP